MPTPRYTREEPVRMEDLLCLCSHFGDTHTPDGGKCLIRECECERFQPKRVQPDMVAISEGKLARQGQEG